MAAVSINVLTEDGAFLVRGDETVKQACQGVVDRAIALNKFNKREADFAAFTDEEKDSAITAEKARQ